MLNTKNVFLVSGQVQEPKLGGRTGLRPVVEQRVVIAADDADAYLLIQQSAPAFQPLGLTSLHALEQAATTVRRVLSGESDAWPLIEDSRR